MPRTIITPADLINALADKAAFADEVLALVRESGLLKVKKRRSHHAAKKAAPARKVAPPPRERRPNGPVERPLDRERRVE